jgi:hypothetical protein
MTAIFHEFIARQATPVPGKKGSAKVMLRPQFSIPRRPQI